ncbi:DUF3237 domain-containing protein [Pseudomonas sp. R5(2019)]|uniref:DUF3237 domain-containing protein n=1 Tax=Pseudomonas sp. R5(2019) TaxID=2697566 RepID=UPI0014129B35|nr:DUF3237 domain-containing protein [Pseudomonas sp. R5(2019)]NBA96014.1 DUF3237 family protein [Pseudomonas sp. R5(2019)]
MNLTLHQEHIFDIRIDFDQRQRFGPVCGGGEVGFTSVAGGVVEGPRLNGRVVPHGGADWADIRPDGVVVINAHYLLELDDGTTVYVQNRGFVVPAKRPADATPDQLIQPAYFRLAPTFKVPLGPHDWLSRTVIVGCGERHLNPDYTLFRYYAMG